MMNRNDYMPKYFLGRTGPPTPVDGRLFGSGNSVTDRILQQRRADYEQYTQPPPLPPRPNLGGLNRETTTTSTADPNTGSSGFGFGDAAGLGYTGKSAYNTADAARQMVQYSGYAPTGGQGVNFGQFGELGAGIDTTGMGAVESMTPSFGIEGGEIVGAQMGGEALADAGMASAGGGAAAGASAGMSAGAMAGLAGGGMVLSGLMSGLMSGDWDRAWKDGLTFGFYSMFGGD